MTPGVARVMKAVAVAGALVLLGALGWWALRSPASDGRLPPQRVVVWTPGGGEVAQADDVPVIALASTGAAPPAGVDVLADAEALRKRYPNLRDVELVGEGLEPAELRAFAGLRLSYRPGVNERPRGLVNVQAPSRLAVGEALTVRGVVAGLSAGSRVTVALEAPDGGTTSVDVAASAEGRAGFSLQGAPAVAPGLFTWRLRVGAERMPLGVEVVAPELPRVLMLAGAPSFEVGRLQRWLAQTGAAVATRTRVSADRVRVQAVNGAPENVERVTVEGLAQIDAVIMDAIELKALDATEAAAIVEAVRTGGLGVLVLAEAGDGMPAGPLFPWKLEPLPVVEEGADRVARLRWAEGAPLAEGASVAAAEVRLAANQEAVLRDGQERVVGARAALGRGWVATTLVRDTWRWPQAGQEGVLAAYWATWLRTVSRPVVAEASWRVAAENGLCVVDRPLHVIWQGRDEQAVPPSPVLVRPVAGKTVPLTLVADPTARETARALYWPTTPGWHRVTVGEGAAVYSFFAHAPGEVGGLLAQARVDATARAVELSTAGVGKDRVAGGDDDIATRAEPGAARWLPWAMAGALFLLLAGLWFAERWWWTAP